MRCTPHGRTNCQDSRCRRERENREAQATSTHDALADPTSALRQSLYGGTYYGAGSSSDCGSSSSSYDSSSSSCGSGE